MDHRKKSNLYDFLEAHCKVSKGSQFTHTSIYAPSASFYVSPEQLQTFWELYKKAILSKEHIYLTEKHRDIGPVVVDLDFRFEHADGDDVERKYTNDDIKTIVGIIGDHLSKYVHHALAEFDVYVMEKPAPVVYKSKLKDGIHIMIPSIVTRPVFQSMVREKMLPRLQEALAHLNLVNKIEDVVDEAVIEKNNWQMYGSRKPHCECYEVTHVLKFDSASGALEEQPLSSNPIDYVETLSIRNKYAETELKFEGEEMKEYEALIHQRKMRLHFKNSIISKIPVSRSNINEEEYQRARSLVDLLCAGRADSYNDWIAVGWCLRNIDHRLLEKWVEFSKKSSKFVEGECEKLWNYMRQEGACLRLGTLHMWAKNDNPEKYNELMQVDLRELIKVSRSGTEYDVAKVVEKLYDHQFLYDSRNKLWYYFDSHRWHLTNDGIALKRKLPTEVVNAYRLQISTYCGIAAQSQDTDEKERLDKLVEDLQAIIKKLKRASFQSSVMVECAMLFEVDKIDEKMDSNPHLIGFENGTYDLNSLEFREGRPEDYLSMTTGNNYVEYDSNNIHVADINLFMQQVLRCEPVREYVMRLLASFLHGGHREERFHVWTGSGSNGKSKCLDLFQQSFGEYCCTLPIALLTQKRGASNAASPELSRAKCKRFASLQEPGENERLNIGLMKEMTGGDKLYARGLYREGTEFKPQFKMVLTCNHLPLVPSDDGGTWRRIRVVKFDSRFCENPDPTKPNEFPIDVDLSQKFEDWKEIFMSMLIECFKQNITNKLKEPDEVLESTREYQRRNDNIADFLDSAVEKHETGFLSVAEAFIEFKSWLKDEGVLDRSMRKTDFQNYIEKQYGKPVKKRLVKGWSGYRLKSSIMESNVVDEYD